MNRYEKKKIREEKLGKLVDKIYDFKNGNRMRQVVRIIADAYQSRAPELKKYFQNENLLIGGIASSAYYAITKDISALQSPDTNDLSLFQSKQFGGLGAIIEESGMDLEFNQDQLHFAKISGTALRGAKFFDNAGWKAEAYGYSLIRVECSDNAMMYCALHDKAGFRAVLKDNAMKYSTRTKGTLHGEKIEDDALYGSKIEE